MNSHFSRNRSLATVRSLGFQVFEIKTKQSPWLDCKLSDTEIKMLIDSGADVNTVSESDWIRVLADSVEGKSVITDVKWGNGERELKAYATTSPLRIEATFSAKISTAKDPPIPATFFVIRGSCKSLLGRETAIALNVLRLGPEINSCELKPQQNASTKPFPVVPGRQVHFDIDASITPTRNAYYNVPAAYREPAQRRLNEMQAEGIIEEVVVAPRWISGMSLVPKGKTDFRLVVNMKGPNRAIKKPFYHLPTIDDMRVKLKGACVFSKLDLKNAFYHFELDEESRELTTFQTATGMKRFKRLMFGVNCAPEIFQREMEDILKNIDGVIVFIDDILIYGENREALRAQTAEVMRALKANNLTINEDKCEHEKASIKFLGHLLSKEGFAIDEGKVRDVKEFVRPVNLTDLRSFLGLATYLSDYIPNFAHMAAPMWDVVKNKPFRWTQGADSAFDATKLAIASCTTTLGFFDESAKTILYTDASPSALGAVLAQEKEGESPRIICFASKLLTPTEKAYPQVQREALGIVWGIERHYYYLLGRQFTVRTDAHGLSFIFDRERTTCKRALNRAEGWALRLNVYDYKIEWIKGSANIADPASRLVNSPIPFELKKRTPWEICPITEGPAEHTGLLSTKRIDKVSKGDPTLTSVRAAIVSQVWPNEVKRYEKVKDELRIRGNSVTRLGTIVIPKDLRAHVLAAAHQGHPGQSAMKSLLRARVWWPDMSKDADNYVKLCSSCNLNAHPEFPVPMRRSSLPEEAWEKLAVDFNGPHSACGNRSILVIVDYFSRFVIARFVRSTDIHSVTTVLESIFELMGNPASIRSDNGPPFNGAEWREYCEAQNIEPEFSTPGHPQQNGLVERYMQIINKAITIAVETSVNPETALRDAIDSHNMATQRTTNIAPEVLLLGRIRRRRVPIMGRTTVITNEEELRERDAKEKQRAQERENAKRKARDTKLKPGDTVLLKRHAKAKDQTAFEPTKFKIISGEAGDFTITTGNGRTYKQNLTQLRKIDPNNGQSAESQDRGNLTDTDTSLGPATKRTRRQPAHLSDYVLNVFNQK